MQNSVLESEAALGDAERYIAVVARGRLFDVTVFSRYLVTIGA